MKSPKSTRNRHTGHINAFKKSVIQQGTKIEQKGRVYYRALVGLVLDKNNYRIRGGYCIVRVK